MISFSCENAVEKQKIKFKTNYPITESKMITLYFLIVLLDEIAPVLYWFKDARLKLHKIFE